jgi:hypothetical protein
MVIIKPRPIVVTKQRNFKMEWAEFHLQTLDKEFTSLLSKPENLYRITAKDDIERGVHEITVDAYNPIGLLKVGLMAGDYVSCLRASLDHVAWSLAKIGKRRPSTETCFPVCPRDSPKTQAKIAAATVGMPNGAVAMVKGFQPYNSGNAYKGTHLWKLNYLWNLDKHRNIAVHSVNSGVLFDIPKGVPVEERKFNDGGIVTIPLSAKDKVRFYPRPETAVLFGDEERGIKVTMQELRDIYDFVSVKVMPRLLSFIP